MGIVLPCRQKPWREQSRRKHNFWYHKRRVNHGYYLRISIIIFFVKQVSKNCLNPILFLRLYVRFDEKNCHRSCAYNACHDLPVLARYYNKLGK